MRQPAPPVCIVIEARNYAAAIALAAPERAVLLTEVGDDWPRIRKRVNRVREYLQRQELAGQWVWHVEPNPNGEGHHVHAWQWDRPCSQWTRCVRRLFGLAWAAPCGPELSGVRTRVGQRQDRLQGAGAMAMGYGMKAGMTGGATGMSLTADQGDYLAVNGQRLAHASHGFWRDEHGRRLRGRKEAVRVALRGRTIGSPDQWAMMTRRAAASTLALPAAVAG